MSTMSWVVLGGAVAALVAVLLAKSGPGRRATWYRTAASAQRRTAARCHRFRIDLLTGLPSRAGIIDRIDRDLAAAGEGDTELAVLFVDIDDFKDINDGFGHTAGDELLVEIGARLVRTVGPDGWVGRNGSDEFIIVVSGTAASRACGCLTARVMARLGEPFQIPSVPAPIRLSASMGIADGWRATPEALLHDADLALTRAKTTGRSRAVVFTPSMQAATNRRHVLESDLRHALDSDEFFLLYQPTFSLATGRLTGVEALLRWTHPTTGVVMPDEFIPSLEATGLIVAVGSWVLERACAQAAVWNADGHRISMSVNVSGRQLERDGFTADVDAQLRKSGLEPNLLTLELTETVLMKNVPRTLRRLRALRASGVRLAVDDFGTGYSSMAYLQRFPIDVIKIDKSFVAEMTETRESVALVHAMVQMAKALELEIVAEGIESEEQRSMLQDEGVDVGQGYLFARPLEATAIVGFLGAKVA